MLIYVNNRKKLLKKKNYVNFYVNLCQYHRQTDGKAYRQTYQKYSSEPYKINLI